MKFIFSALLTLSFAQAGAANLPLNKLKLPPGFKIEVFAEVPSARSLAQAPDGRIFVGTRQENVYVVKNGKTELLAEGLNQPNGVAFKDGKLYVAEVSRILEFDGSLSAKLPMKPLRELPVKFPTDTHHGWKFIRFGPDGKLYVPVGANCNICDPKKDYARIYRVNDLNKADKEVIAEGVRNTVGFDWHPDTKQLWFTDNGRDWLGDDQPPCEINQLVKEKSNFGFPYCHGKNLLDPDFGKGKNCADYVAPVVELRAHVAPLGMRFYTGKAFPETFSKGIFFAEHGSWNRSIPQGYRVAFLQAGATEPINFIDGFLQGSDAWGRPVDIEQLADGSILISDDKANVIYKVTYSASKKK
jgi:Glucose/sorbosone dehydrogenases